MKEKDDLIRACIYKLYDFRANIPANLDSDKVKKVWNVEIEQEKIPKLIHVQKDLLHRKIEITERSLKWLVLKPFVRFIGISGSVASEFPQDEDDIDLFIVTKNDTAWIYRLYLYLMNISHKKIRSNEKVRRGEGVKDKFCINLITEERCLYFEDDIFNLNELLYIKPVYNKDFLNVIYLNNHWLRDKYFVSEKFLNTEVIKVKDVKNLTRRNLFLVPINTFCFIGQICFMMVMKHNPDYGRLWRGFLDGKIEFFPKDFKKEKIN